MNIKKLSKIVLALALVISSQIGYAEEWQTIDHYQVKNGVAKDTKTGLMWMRCPLGMKWKGETCVGKSNEYTWKKAMQTAKSTKYAGNKNWRVPTVEELRTITGNQDGNIPDTNPVFPRSFCNDTQKQGNCIAWTSSNHENRSNFAWILNINDGHEDYSGKEGKVAVQLVRDEK